MQTNPWAILLILGAVACGPGRSIDGRENNPLDPSLGAAASPLRRLVPSDYADGISALADVGRPNPRYVSNAVNAQVGSVPNTGSAAGSATDFLWQWGQFLDHDIDLTPEHEPLEFADIQIPAGDEWFGPGSVIPFTRSIYDPATGAGADNPRQQLNLITPWIDASNVYGSDPERASELRTNDGTGRLKTSSGNLLPFNTAGLPNAGGSDAALFLAGDTRANEQVGLTAMHTLFVREHNRVAGLLGLFGLPGDEIYEACRRWVGALMQAITFREYLPALLGPYAPSARGDYDPTLDAQISNIFSTALYRFGHSQLNTELLRLDARGNEIAAGHLSLRDAFFNPDETTSHGIEPVLRGLASQVAQAVDVHVIDDVRSFLFGPPGAGGLDLASLNIQRGRDHGLPRYNDTRAILGLPVAADYDDISSDPLIAQRLEDAYGVGNVDDVDLWVGGLAEDHLPGAHVGLLIAAVLVEQFEALRDGDRFWYRRDLPFLARMAVESMRLSDVIRLNTTISHEIQSNVFRIPRQGGGGWRIRGRG